MRPELIKVNNIYVLGFCVWREARAEITDGLAAVAYSILNRVAHPKWWGQSIDSVVYKPWQYSSMTDPHDPQLIRYPQIGKERWDECLAIAADVLGGVLPNPVPTADSYYATWMDTKKDDKGKVMTPDWAVAKTTRFVAQIGNHKFFDTDGEHPENVVRKAA